MSGSADLMPNEIATGAPTVISVHGRPIRVRVDGSTASPPVLLLHGIGRSLEDWAPQYERLADSYRIIALDLPGFGYSARRPEAVTLHSLARGVLDTLDALGEHRPLNVIGNSLGGAIALQLLAIRPAQIASLVLVNSAGFGRDVTPLLRMLAVPGIGWLATRRTTRASARMLERAIYADKSLVTDARIDHAIAVARQPDRGDVMYQAARALATARGVRSHWRAQQAAVAVKHPKPTLILWGECDRVLPARHLDQARRVMPHATTHLLAATGHMPQVEQPDEFCRIATEFLRGVIGAY